ncbi:MAG: excinuclease ABC subunit UvrC [Thermoguttaceae bacterium]|jgi:excinuclease ABC subunit C
MNCNPPDREPEDNRQAARKARSLPQTPGVYLMKDAAGQVLYVGKAKNLRARAGSYFLKAAAEDPRTARLVREIRDLDFLEAESEVDALLVEARLIKDILPKYNRELRDQKTFPYLEIHTHEDFPRVEITRTPKERGTKLYGPFTNLRGLRGALVVLQKIFRFRTCSLDIREGDPRWRWFRPCLLASIRQCTAPCNLRISKEEYRKDIHRLQQFLEGNKRSLLAELGEEMAAAAKELRFEDAARLRDEIHLLETLNERGELETHVQPEVFPVDPKKGLAGLRKVLRLAARPRTIEGIDVAHTAGSETVASVVQFIDGLPFKPGYKRMRIRGVEGPDDVASIYEAVARRFAHPGEEEVVPDLLLVDGGKGQLHAALSALEGRPDSARPAAVVALAKREELVFPAGWDEPLRLSRHSYALRLLQYVRDEAHRFAQHYHHILRRRSTLGE